MKKHIVPLLLCVCCVMAWMLGSVNTPAFAEEVLETVFANGNLYAVMNNPTAATTFTPQENCLVRTIINYHWNDQKGSPPGQIGLRRVIDGALIGQWNAVAESGYLDTPNAYWYIYPDVMLQKGVEYRVIDSRPETWSWNDLSGGSGFTEVKGIWMASIQNGQDATTQAADTSGQVLSDSIMGAFRQAAFLWDDSGSSIIHRWEKPIILWAGGAITAADQAFLQAFVRQLGERVAGLPPIKMTNQKSQANIVLTFAPQAEMYKYVESVEEGDWYHYEYLWNEEASLDEAKIAIASDVSNQTERNYMSLAALTNVLGLFGEIADEPTSILYHEWTDIQELGEIDWTLLGLLYDARISSGMDEQRAFGVLQRGLDPTNQVKSTQQPAATDVLWEPFRESAFVTDDSGSSWLHRWQKPITLWAGGEMTAEDLATLMGFINQLGERVAGLPQVTITNQKSQAGIVLTFAPQAEMPTHVSTAQEDDWYRYVFSWIDDQSIDDAAIVIASDVTDQANRNYSILTTLVRVLGLDGSITGDPNSILFDDWTDLQELNDTDWGLLNRLYDPRINAGMNEQEVAEALKGGSDQSVFVVDTDRTTPAANVSGMFRQAAFATDEAGISMIHRWENPIIVWAGGAITAADKAFLETFIGQLGEQAAGLPSIKMTNQKNRANIVLTFAPQAEMHKYVKSAKEDNWYQYTYWWDENKSLDKAAIAIASDISNQTERNYMSLITMMKVLGLFGEITDDPTSILFEEWTDAQELSQTDWALLGVLYDARINSGMNEQQVNEALGW